MRTEIIKSHLNNHICQHRGMKTSTVTPSFYYVFNISLYCNDSIPSFIGNLWRVLLPGNHLKCPKVRGTFSLGSNASKRIASLPRVCRTSLGRFQSARKLLALWASPCACAWSDLKCPKVQATFSLRSNACKRIASFPRVRRTSLGRFQSARKLLALWASPCACVWSDLKCPKVRETFSLRSNACKRIASLPRVCRTSLGRFQSARKLLALWASPCACAWSDLKWPKVRGTFSLRSNACKRIASLPRVCRTSLGRFQSARKLLALWASPCACAWSDLRWPKVRGTFSLRCKACKRIASLPRVCRASLGRFQSARKLLALWASPCACAWSDRWPLLFFSETDFIYNYIHSVQK